MEIIGTTNDGSAIAILTNAEIEFLTRGNFQTTREDRWDSWLDTEVGKLFIDYKPITTKKDLIRNRIRFAYIQGMFDGSVESLAKLCVKLGVNRTHLRNWGKVRHQELCAFLEQSMS